MGMFLKVDGVSGGAKDREHAGEIDVLAWSWEMSKPEVAQGQAWVQDLALVKHLDEASPKLQMLCLNGQYIRSATLTCTTDSTARTFLQIKLYEVVVSTVAAGGSDGEDRFTENISLNFGDVLYSYTTFGSDNSEETERLRWDRGTKRWSVESVTQR